MSIATLVTLTVGAFGLLGSYLAYKNGKNSNKIDVYRELREQDKELKDTNKELKEQQQENIKLRGQVEELKDTVADLQRQVKELKNNEIKFQ